MHQNKNIRGSFKAKAAVLMLAALATASASYAGKGTALSAVGALAGAAVKSDPQTRVAASLAGFTAGKLIGNHMDNTQRKRELEAYMLGRYQQAYSHAYDDWYKATLDPTTGRAPAFDGYWAMDIGLMAQASDQANGYNLVPTDKISVMELRDELGLDQAPAPQSTTAAPASVIMVERNAAIEKGVPMRRTQAAYPTLPVRQ